MMKISRRLFMRRGSLVAAGGFAAPMWMQWISDEMARMNRKYYTAPRVVVVPRTHYDLDQEVFHFGVDGGKRASCTREMLEDHLEHSIRIAREQDVVQKLTLCDDRGVPVVEITSKDPGSWDAGPLPRFGMFNVMLPPEPGKTFTARLEIFLDKAARG